MLQRRTPSEDLDTVNCSVGRTSTFNGKVTVKEKKAAKRKEKSRVAAQIRRNKESQTLILLQNALPLALPSPSQMLEKSIVIRIAGQTLFLMNTLDQVLGMDGWLTIPLISNNFLTFFMDSTGQIVYASPNIQLLLEQYHWSNLIGMSIYDVIDFKYRWPIVGEVVRMKLTTNQNVTNDSSSFVASSSTNLQPSCSRTTIASRLNLKKTSQAWNSSSSTCSLYNVWCYTNINHTNFKLKLLILQAVKIKSSVLNNVNYPQEITKHVILSNSSTMSSIERSVSWPPMSNQIKMEPVNLSNSLQQQPDNWEPDPTNSICIYQNMMTSAHDKYYNFKSASTEFSQLIGEIPNSLIGLNFLDIIHLEDVIKVKSFLDLIVDNNDSHIWTPIYRIMCQNGQMCVMKTLAKQYSTTSSHSLILNHLLIEITHTDDHFTMQSLNDRNRSYNIQDNLISMSLESNKIGKTLKKEMYIIRSDSENSTVLKRKSIDKKRMVSCEKYPRVVGRTLSGPIIYSNSYTESDQSHKLSTKNQSLLSTKKSKFETEMLNNDPFLPLDLDRGPTFRKSRKDDLSSFSDTKIKLVTQPLSKGNQLQFNDKYDRTRNRSPSYSLESCVMTSPGSESTDVPFDDNFVWDVATNFSEFSQLNCWLDDQDQNDLELILPI